MSSSTFTPNLGIEQPATGMYANTWGVVANRSYAVLDAAIGSSAQITIVSSPGQPYQLTTQQASDPSNALYPLIFWIGAQTAQGNVMIGPSTEQRLYIMSNQTTGGFPIAFQQSDSGSQFILQPNCDAYIYADGGGSTANVAAAIANPQFNNVLVQGNLTLDGALISSGGGLSLGDASMASLGIGSPTSVPDPLTINGLGHLGGQIRLVENNGINCGVILRNDGNTFYVLTTNSNDPYGSYNSLLPFSVDLASGAVALGGWSPNTAYGLNTPSIHCGTLVADSTMTCVGLTANAGIVVDAGASNTGAGIDVSFGSGTGIGIGAPLSAGSINQNGLNLLTGGSPRVYITSAGRVGIGTASPDQLLTVAGYIHTTAGGIVFPDGSVQTTAVSGTFTQLTVNGNSQINGSQTVTGALNVAGTIYGLSGPYSPRLFLETTSIAPSMDINCMCITQQYGGVELWYHRYDGTYWYTQLGPLYQWTGAVGP